MASGNIARFIFFSMTLVAFFVSHECVDNSREMLAKINGEKQMKYCSYSTEECTYHLDHCWCCVFDDLCYGELEQCGNSCIPYKHFRKVLS
ncbi:hypothetical protein ABFS83_08G215400 [Erythranthe nasuta]